MAPVHGGAELIQTMLTAGESVSNHELFNSELGSSFLLVLTEADAGAFLQAPLRAFVSYNRGEF